MNDVSTSEGKVILLGEHSVVYGYPAIVTGIPDGANAKATWSSSTSLTIAGERLVPGHAELELALGALLRELGNPTVSIDVHLLVPAGLGLGASAATGVAIARAVLRLTSPNELQPLKLFEHVTTAAQAWENVFHGNSSGIDVTAAALGGCFQFTRGKGPESIAVTKALPLVIAAAGPQVSTKVMVGGLARLRELEPQRVEQTFESIHALVRRAKTAIELGDLATLGHLMDLNQSRLSELNLSSDRLESACQLARDAGALGAKLTGKGGGGCIVALCHSDPTPILSAFRARGIDAITTTVPANAKPRSMNATP
jgi:mevalonate kinase